MCNRRFTVSLGVSTARRPQAPHWGLVRTGLKDRCPKPIVAWGGIPGGPVHRHREAGPPLLLNRFAISRLDPQVPESLYPPGGGLGGRGSGM